MENVSADHHKKGLNQNLPMTFRLTFVAIGFDIITKVTKRGLHQEKMQFHAQAIT